MTSHALVHNPGWYRDQFHNTHFRTQACRRMMQSVKLSRVRGPVPRSRGRPQECRSRTRPDFALTSASPVFGSTGSESSHGATPSPQPMNGSSGFRPMYLRRRAGAIKACALGGHIFGMPNWRRAAPRFAAPCHAAPPCPEVLADFSTVRRPVLCLAPRPIALGDPGRPGHWPIDLRDVVPVPALPHALLQTQRPSMPSLSAHARKSLRLILPTRRHVPQGQRHGGRPKARGAVGDECAAGHRPTAPGLSM